MLVVKFNLRETLIQDDLLFEEEAALTGNGVETEEDPLIAPQSTPRTVTFDDSYVTAPVPKVQEEADAVLRDTYKFSDDLDGLMSREQSRRVLVACKPEEEDDDEDENEEEDDDDNKDEIVEPEVTDTSSTVEAAKKKKKKKKAKKPPSAMFFLVETQKLPASCGVLPGALLDPVS